MSASISSSLFSRVFGFVSFACLVVLVTVSVHATQQSPQPLPIVISASTPVYPILARQARIMGVVKLRLTTDGKQVSDVQVLSGPPMLAKAATENVKTWRFRPHQPTSFETTFNYRYLDDLDCDIDNGTITLHLPAEIEVAVRRWVTCDPVEDLTKPAIVNLTVKLNGKIVAPPKQIILTVGAHSMEIQLRNGQFAAPPEVLQSKSVGLSAEIGGDQIQIGDIYGGKFTEELWTLILADKYFPHEYDRGTNGADPRSTCVLVWESEFSEGTEVVDTRCRSRIKK